MSFEHKNKRAALDKKEHKFRKSNDIKFSAQEDNNAYILYVSDIVIPHPKIVFIHSKKGKINLCMHAKISHILFCRCNAYEIIIYYCEVNYKNRYKKLYQIKCKLSWIQI